MAAASYLEQQQDEIEALRSMYGDDFESIHIPSPWTAKSVSAPTFKIKIVPHPAHLSESAEAETANHVSVALRVSFPKQYPKSAPELVVEKGRGLSNDALASLSKSLQEQAEKHRGAVMIFDLVSFAQEFLLQHNTKQVSFYEEMMARERKTAEEHRRQEIADKKRKQKEEKAAKEMMVVRLQEERKKQQDLFQARFQRHDADKADSDDDDEKHAPSNKPSFNPSEGTPATSPLNNSKLKPSPSHSSAAFALPPPTALSVDVNANPSAALFSVSADSTIVRKTSDDSELSSPSPIHGISSGSFSPLKSLTKTATSKQKTATKEPSSRAVAAFRRLPGTPSSHGDGNEDADEDSAAEDDEDNDIEDDEHKDEEAEEWFAQQQAQAFALPSFSMGSASPAASSKTPKARKKKVERLSDDDDEESEASEIESGSEDDVTDRKTAKGSQNAEKRKAQQQQQSPVKSRSALKAPLVADDFDDDDGGVDMFGHKSNRTAAYARKAKGKAKAMNQQKLNRAGSLKVPPAPVAEEAEDDDESKIATALHEGPEIHFGFSPPHSPTATVMPVPHRSSLSLVSAAQSSQAAPRVPSRYEKDFEELGLLGKGGFGEVWRVRNRIDGLTYAIKKIKLSSKQPSVNKKIMREVLLISRLHHQYIVRYYQAWVEAADGQSASKGGADADDFSLSDVDDEDEEDEDNQDDDDEAVGGDWLSANSTNTNRAQTRNSKRLNRAAGSTAASVAAARKRKSSESSDVLSDDETQSQASVSSSIGAGFKGTQYLYIQMEYCPRNTLKNLFEEGLHQQPDQIWRLFRQILEAMQHIHSKGITHRDIKPDNIFIDSKGNIKLGDFGLAVLSNRMMGSVPPQNPRSISALNPLDSDNAGLTDDEPDSSSVSEVVGTPFYRAPEQEVPGAEYASKADMYALGIIFFEMWRPFGTLSERAYTLKDLRQSGRLPIPPGFETPELSKVTRIVENLLQRQPDLRPSASELLKSGLIPLQIEDEYLDLALQAAANPTSAFYARLMDSLFSAPVDDYVDFLFDSNIGARINRVNDEVSGSGAGAAASSPSRRGGAGGSNDVMPALVLGRNMTSSDKAQAIHPMQHGRRLAQMHVFDSIAAIFRNHGASYLPTPLIAPKTTKLEQDNAAVFLNPAGTLVQLPHSLTIPFARHVALHLASRHSFPWLRRYDIAKVYRRGPTDGRPKEVFECDFDVVWPLHERGSDMMPEEKSAYVEAEAIRVVDEVLTQFSPALGQFTIFINHLDIVDAILDDALHISAAGDAPGLHVSTSPIIVPSHPMPQNGPLLGNVVSDEKSSAHSEPQSDVSARLLSEVRANILSMSAARQMSSSFSAASSTAASAGANKESYAWTFGTSLLRKKLAKQRALSPQSLERLSTLFEVRSEEPGRFDSVFQRLSTLLVSKLKNATGSASSSDAERTLAKARLQRLLKALDAVHALISHLKILGVIERVVFDVSLVCNYNLYAGGTVFQVFAAGPQGQAQGPRGLLALGGRYDSLVSKFRSPLATGAALCAMGANIAIEKIVASVTQLESNPAALRAMSRHTLHRHAPLARMKSNGVLLFASQPGVLLKERIARAAILWDHQIRAEYLYPPSLSVNTVRVYCKELGLRWLVVYRPKPYEAGRLIRIRDLRAKDIGDKDQDVWRDIHESDLLSVVNPKSNPSAPADSQKQLKTKSSKVESSASSDAANASKTKGSRAQWATAVDVEILDVSHHSEQPMRVAQKQKVAAQVATLLGPLLSRYPSNSYKIIAIDLPLLQIRDFITSFQVDRRVGGAKGGDSASGSSSSSKGGGSNSNSGANSNSGGTSGARSSNETRRKQDRLRSFVTDFYEQSTVNDAAKKSKDRTPIFLYIFSMPDRKVDMMLCS